MLSVLGFLAVLGPLVIVHEFGHYIFARIFNVKAEIFSIGFGPKLWSRRIGETEWRVSAVPLGGYVKLLGEEGDVQLSPEEAKRALQRQKPWKRFFIFFGGPLFNFIFAIFVFAAILVIGEPQMSSVVGRVVRGSPAEKAGFVSGDRILTVDGKPVKRFEDVAHVINEKPNEPVRFEVLRKSAAGAESRVAVTATPTPQDGFSVYGESKPVGDVDGLLPAGRAATVGISDPASAAAKAGLKTGDRIVAVNGAEIDSWERLEQLYAAAAPGSTMTFKVGDREVKLTKPQGATTPGDAWGMHSSELFVEKAVPKSPAEGAGIQGGDRLVAIAGREVQSFFELRDAVQSAGEKDGKVAVRWERAGKSLDATLTPTATETRDPALKKKTQFTIGVVPQLVWAQPETFLERTLNPFTLVFKATERMITFTYRNVVSLGKMVTGDVSVATLGGPILIGKIAGESLSRGLIDFLRIMAVLSIGLGVLNVLPVPVLDGGHLLLLAIESVRGKPLTIRQMEIVQQVGLSLILLLMVIVMRNDIARLTTSFN